jgi:hypothetical protein
LKAGIIRAIFHVDGNMPFCKEKLKIIAKGIQMVSEVLMIKHAREQFLLSANALVDSFQRNDSKSYWSLIRKLMKGTSQNYSIPPLYDNDSNELI